MADKETERAKPIEVDGILFKHRDFEMFAHGGPAEPGFLGQQENSLKFYVSANERFRIHHRHGGGLAKASRSKRVSTIRARLYVESTDAVDVLNVFVAYAAVMGELGFGRVDIAEVQRGSVWLRLKQSYVKLVNKRKVRLVATQLVGAVEGYTAEKYQAENTATHANAVANLADKTKHLKSFSFDPGPLQYVQWEDDQGDMHGMARVVNSKDIASKRLDDDIVQNPRKMAEVLATEPDVISGKSTP